MTPRFDSAAQLRIQSLNGVRRVDDPPHRYGKGEERNDLGPVTPPALGDCRIFSSPSAGVGWPKKPIRLGSRHSNLKPERSREERALKLVPRKVCKASRSFVSCRFHAVEV